MSDVYIRRLLGIETEFNAAQRSLVYADRNWQRHALYRDFGQTTPRDLTRTVRGVEATYFIRLYAEFEGILKDHLASNHTGINVPAKPKVDWLISKIIRAEGINLDPILRHSLDAVRNYRNSIAHQTQAAVPTVSLVRARSTLNTFLAKLPDPLT